MTIPLPTIYAVTRAGIVSLTFSLLGCGSSVPPRLYLLSGGSGAAAIASQERGGGRAQQGEIALVSATPGVRLGVAVTIPQYLDRPEIMVRTNEYELEPMENARWAEGLTITASRAIADDLSMLLPRDDVVSLPTRTNVHSTIESTSNSRNLISVQTEGRRLPEDGSSSRCRLTRSARVRVFDMQAMRVPWTASSPRPR